MGGDLSRSPSMYTLSDYYAEEYGNGAAGQVSAGDTTYTLYDYYAEYYRQAAAAGQARAAGEGIRE